MERKIIRAKDGKILTDGAVFGREIYLAEGTEESRFYEITEEEYNKISEEQENAE